MKVIGGKDLKKGHLISFDKLHVLDSHALALDKFEGISDPGKHEAVVEDALLKIAAAGPTGRLLATFARISRDLDLVCWPGVPGEFLCPEEAAKAGHPLTNPTILWDPYATFAYFAAGQPQSAVLARVEALQGAPARIPPPPRYKATLMPAWVVLAHEIGHFYHYRHSTAWFVNCLEGGDIAEIERRNLADHEGPILKASGLPLRVSYQDFKGGSNDTADKHILWSTLRHGDPALCATASTELGVAKQAFDSLLSAATIKKQAQDARGKVVAPTVSSKDPCPKCKKLFTPRIMLSHQPACRG